MQKLLGPTWRASEAYYVSCLYLAGRLPDTLPPRIIRGNIYPSEGIY